MKQILNKKLIYFEKSEDEIQFVFENGFIAKIEPNLDSKNSKEFFNISLTKNTNGLKTKLLKRIKEAEKEKHLIDMYVTNLKKTKKVLSFTGRTLSPEAREKIRQAHLGRKLSKETKRKISDSRKGKPTRGKKKIAYI